MHLKKNICIIIYFESCDDFCVFVMENEVHQVYAREHSSVFPYKNLHTKKTTPFEKVILIEYLVIWIILRNPHSL